MGAIVRLLITVVLLLAILTESCASQISEQQAEKIATGFVKERVKFFTRDSNSTIDLPTYEFGPATTSKSNGSYVVSFMVSSRFGNETKTAHIIVTVNGQGEVKNLERGQLE